MASSLIVPVATIDSIAPHPGADRLEIAQVLGWQVVVPKGRYLPGARVVYFPPDAIVPKEHSDRFGVTQYLANGRVKCARLRGVPSYGFLFAAETEDPVGTNLAAHYGVTKFEPPIRPFAGDGLPDHDWFPRYTDLENLRNFPDVLQRGEPVVFTEKVHGTNCRVGIVRGQRMAGSNRVRRAEPSARVHENPYWMPFTLPSVVALLEHFAASDERVVLYGETYGRGVQSFHYGARSALGFAAFDLRLGERFLDWAELQAALQRFAVPAAPVLYQGPYAPELLARYAAGKTTFDDAHIREGLVVRPQHERFDVRVGRVVMKYIADDYLLDEKRSDYTEA
ncbi:MAG: RNA ligase (ATP) [Planctomycetes bacterium]|jgi:RNA ligase (TIGR02306 family)|nr:RNA ligase (ATP) [Planctomycetota bacterium]